MNRLEIVLRDFLDEYKDKRAIPHEFIKQHTVGLYLYGKRYINLQLDIPNQLSVKVGDGVIPIDKFI